MARLPARGSQGGDMIPEMIGLLVVEQASGKTEKVFIPRGAIIQAGREPEIASQFMQFIRSRPEIKGAIQIILEDRVSFLCMEFTVKGAEVFVTDLCSKAGVLRLNNAMLGGLFEETRLQSGDVLEIGHTRITFQEIARDVW
jgi:hypothetical protein